ncbi:PAS domain-containing protein [Methylobacterium nonmethylotrophicum]|uniref:PAS domain-containing protein n=1 Tax=Methylobacterium nonmethylotrophicum TaxID=1141884 RepID=A0A4Z0NTU7_9HYPH|nr:PAS domain-containing protein [Methylobacterium nonmethylotrophicum]TGE00625.1 PAS domain-containing protein [Methylobacterium nonmethylotrophicum]
MELADLVRLFADSLDLAVVLTDVDLARPGPTVLYANPAFARMSGYAAEEVVGASPRLLQGPGTSREATRHLPRLLRTEGRFLGCLRNYRKGGEEYLCEIDVRPILGRDGTPQAFIAFEREVVRRRGRPSDGGTRRYRPAIGAASPLGDAAIPLFA